MPEPQEQEVAEQTFCFPFLPNETRRKSGSSCIRGNHPPSAAQSFGQIAAVDLCGWQLSKFRTRIWEITVRFNRKGFQCKVKTRTKEMFFFAIADYFTLCMKYIALAFVFCVMIMASWQSSTWWKIPSSSCL